MKLTDIYSAQAVAMNWNEHQREANIAPYLGEALFPVRKKMGLDLKWVKGSSGLPISLMPSAFDADAKLRDRIGVTQIETEMPFFREAFLIKEADRQEILRVQDSNDPYAQAVLDNIYKDAQNLIDGANVVPERMRMQLLAPINGEVAIQINANGANYQYDYDANDAWKATNYKALTSTAMWSDTEHADPISDIEAAIDTVEDATGVKPTLMIVSKATMKYLRDNDKLKGYILAKSVNAVVRMTDQLVKDYIAEELGVTIVVYSKKYKDESGNVQKFYPDDYATLVPSAGLGNTYFGTTPEEADFVAGGGDTTAIVNTGVSVSVVHKNHPVNAETIASEVVLPSFEAMDQMYVLKVHTAAQADDGE